ncbi:hypothetical protein GCM10011514_08720 [Emticicia aquatilis]|uniref:DUF3185 family protein n=2 Tax=Emticicia aquatilis TaxID=1537369 RepID=A0A916YIC0_9BACT|nr:hypothetical protein GCM10011514_08720 [Emticicia aquatilis]
MIEIINKCFSTTKLKNYMNTNRIIGIVLIIVSLFIGYTGINKISQNDASVKVLGLKIDASNESGKNQGFIYIGIAAIMFIGGIVTLNKKQA